MKIIKVEILSHNLIETEKFYSDRLGLTPIAKSNNLLSYLTGGSELTFHKCEIENPIYHFAFNIPKNQLHEAERWLTSRLTPLTSAHKNIIDFKNWNAKSIYFLDNNGNVLELIARYDLNNEAMLILTFQKQQLAKSLL